MTTTAKKKPARPAAPAKPVAAATEARHGEKLLELLEVLQWAQDLAGELMAAGMAGRARQHLSAVAYVCGHAGGSLEDELTPAQCLELGVRRGEAWAKAMTLHKAGQPVPADLAREVGESLGLFDEQRGEVA